MSRRRSSSSRVVAVFALFALLASTGCGSLENPGVPLSSRPSFGELVYRVLKARMVASAVCSNEYVDELETHHGDFVTTFDYVIDHGVRDDFPELLGGTLKPFLDNDKLPRLVDQLAVTLALLVSDEFDPNRETIQSMVNLAEAQTLLESSIAIQAAATLLEDPTITDKIHALAALAQENDGVTYLMDDLFDVASYALASDATPSTCSGIETPSAQDSLLRTSGFVDYPALALESPFYLARPDLHGNPQVNFVDGAILPPFVDADADGAADVDADGEPVDANGARIDIPMIGEDGAEGRDEFGRAVDSQGRLYYAYYDVKRTALSFTMQLGADMLETRVHHQLPTILGAVLGTPTTCSDGTNCRRYPSANNVVADLAWYVLEIAEYSRISVLMNTLSDLLTTDPTKAEQLLVAVGDIVRAVDATTLSLTDTAMTEAVRGMIPPVAGLFATPPGGGPTTASLLIDAFEALGTDADEIPSDLHFTILNQADLVTDQEPNATNAIESVDLSQPRFPASGDDNRTGLEQVTELFDYADCGFIGPLEDGENPFETAVLARVAVWALLDALPGTVHPGTLAEVFVEILGYYGPQISDVLFQIIDKVTPIIGQKTLAQLIHLITGGGNHEACSTAESTQIGRLFPGLTVLSAADGDTGNGALSWIIAVIKVTSEAGQRRTFIDFAKNMSTDLRRDEDGDPNTHSAFRRMMPAMLEMSTPQVPGDVFSTPLNRVFDAVDILRAIPASDGNGAAFDVLVDALGYMTATRSVTTRPVNGTASGTTTAPIARLLLDEIIELQTRVGTAGAGDELSTVVDAVTPLLTTTVGSGASRRLANPNLRLLFATYAEVVAAATDLPTDDYLCYIHDVQSESAEFFETKHFATLVRILNHLATSPNATALEDWALTVMRGNPDRNQEMYGRVLQLASGALSSDASSEDLSKILDWLGASLNANGAGGMRELVQTLDELIASDANGSLLTMARTVLAPGPLASRERPLNTFVDIASEISEIDSNNMCSATGTNLDPADVEEIVEGVSDFLRRDPNDGRSTGIEQIWDIVGTIAPEE